MGARDPRSEDQGGLNGRFPDPICTKPAEIDPDTPRNRGPLVPLAGAWEGARGLDVNPTADARGRAPHRLMRKR